MQEAFLAKNLNLDFMASIAKYYEEIGSSDERPDGRITLKSLLYEEVDGPSSKDMCRLVILPMDTNPQLGQKLFSAASRVLDVLPDRLNAVILNSMTDC
mgnify:CR=1 FL=1